MSNAFPPNRTHDENIAQYLKDCQDGRYDHFHVAAGETYNTECRTFWTGIRHRAARVNSDHFHATNKLTENNTKSPWTDSQNSHNDRNDIDTQSNDRGANAQIIEGKEALAELDNQERGLLWRSWL